MLKTKQHKLLPKKQIRKAKKDYLNNSKKNRNFAYLFNSP